MHIHCLGLNHETASVDLREKLAFNDEQVRAALSSLGCGIGLESISEMIIISTCNRVELYAVSKDKFVDSLQSFLVTLSLLKETNGLYLLVLKVDTNSTKL